MTNAPFIWQHLTTRRFSSSSLFFLFIFFFKKKIPLFGSCMRPFSKSSPAAWSRFLRCSETRRGVLFVSVARTFCLPKKKRKKNFQKKSGKRKKGAKRTHGWFSSLLLFCCYIPSTMSWPITVGWTESRRPCTGTRTLPGRFPRSTIWTTVRRCTPASTTEPTLLTRTLCPPAWVRLSTTF